jgi:P-type Cu2+ transporter
MAAIGSACFEGTHLTTQGEGRVNSELWDDPTELEHFTEIKESAAGRYVTAMFYLSGLRCASCASIVSRALARLPGVVSQEVNFASQRAKITFAADRLNISAIVEAVRAAGYVLTPVTSIARENARASENRVALWRLAVAGFCMMQIMMYTAPGYLAGVNEIEPDIAALLRWASWTLSVPVLLFSASPFFTSAWTDLRHGRIGMDVPVALGIGIAFVAGTMATVQPTGVFGGESYLDAISMLVFFLLAGRYLEQKVRARTAGAVDMIVHRLPEAVERLNPESSNFECVAARRLRIGDVLRIRAGQAFPADGTVMDNDVQADEAMLTGESAPVLRKPGDTVLAGTYNLGGPALVRVSKLGTATRFAEIAQLMERVAAQKPRLALIADWWAGKFLWGVLTAAIAGAAFWWITSPAEAPQLPLRVAVAVLIVTCPCALALATPCAMLAAAGALAKKGILVQKLQSLEALADADRFVFDKTGTLTEDRLTLNSCHIHGVLVESEVLSLAASVAQHSLHPVARALRDAGRERGLTPVSTLRSIKEYPGAGIEAVDVDGQTIRLGSPRFCGATLLSDETVCVVTRGGLLLATFEFAEVLRSDAIDAVRNLKDRGASVTVLSGDQVGAVAAIAARIGADAAIGGVSPEEKLRVLAGIQEGGLHRVVMTGDGVNDAPVLARADVSIALGKAAPLAQSRADLIVLSGRINDVVFSADLARRTLRIVKQNLLWAVAYNFACVPLAIAGILPPWLAGLGMAASSLSVVLNALRVANIPQGDIR